MTDAQAIGGVDINERLKELFSYIRLQTDKDGHVVRDPNTERGEAVSRQAEGLQKIVESSLADSKTGHVSRTADHEKANDIVYKLSQELAKTYGHKDLATLPEDRRKEFLNMAISAIGVPGVSNENQLVQSIMNMARPGAKPGDPLYDQDAALVQLTRYIAGRKDEEQGKFNAILTDVLNAYQQPNQALHIVESAKKGGIKVGPSATAAQFQTAVREFQANETRRYVDAMPKTYHNGGNVGGGAHAPH
ncbi:MAG TPA: hypothetical protein VJJ52_08185 [Candidatus Nanoarchaeia archaeon]|nr:hypothetical protein [Candidatus Nanoarchaeia archaeon]